MYLVFPPRLWLCMHVCKEICLMYAATAADLKCDLAYFMVIMCQMKLLLLAKCNLIHTEFDPVSCNFVFLIARLLIKMYLCRNFKKTHELKIFCYVSRSEFMCFMVIGIIALPAAFETETC